MLKTRLFHQSKTIIGDMMTPVMVLMQLQNQAHFLLESVEKADQIGRYSFIGLNPICTIQHKDDTTTIHRNGNNEVKNGNPIDILENVMAEYDVTDDKELPFMGGAVGFFGWNTIAKIEPIKRINKPKAAQDDMFFMIPGTVIVFDHVKRVMTIVALSEKNDELGLNLQIQDLMDTLSSVQTLPQLSLPETTDNIFDYVTSNMTHEHFINSVKTVKQHIYDGDIFQLVFSQKFFIESRKSPIDIYRTLRMINPSPYMFFYHTGVDTMIGSSPEIMARLTNNVALVRPLAGTRPRGKRPDDELIAELKVDPKEIAEHIMLVDLGRNDLGRVCDYKSIGVDNMMHIEKYSHVMHMISDVSGLLKENKNAFDLLKATFPAGTLSGAPKVSAINIIESIEPDDRGVYGGALGYIDFKGNMDLCIIIRTIVHDGERYCVQAGAGLVADSDPQTEFEESQNKAKALLMACKG